MKFRIRFAEQIVGLFVLIAIFSLSLLLVMMGINQRWFAKEYHFISRFDSANGLSAGMPVRFKGFKIGAVDSVSLTDENSVELRFHIFDTYYNRIVPDSVLELAVSPIGIGGGGLLFHQGSGGGSPLPEGSEIPVLSSPRGRELVAEQRVAIPASSDAVSELLGQVGPTVASLRTVLTSLDKLLISVDDLIQGRNDAELGGLLANSERITGDLSRISSDAAEDSDELLANITRLSRELSDTTGLISRLLDAKGSLPRILDDGEALYSQVGSILASLSASTGELEELLRYSNSKKPQISTLLDQTIEAIGEGQDVLTGLKNNPLLRGGIPENPERQGSFGGYRRGEF